jgi:hypothetical protein
MFKQFAIVCAVASVLTANVWAEDSADLVQPPVIPETLQDGESIEPEVNIIQKDDRTIEEYRLNGQLYMIKVIPSVGKPYYLVDSDGDGNLESKSFELESGAVPNWVLFEW